MTAWGARPVSTNQQVICVRLEGQSGKIASVSQGLTSKHSEKQTVNLRQAPLAGRHHNFCQKLYHTVCRKLLPIAQCLSDFFLQNYRRIYLKPWSSYNNWKSLMSNTHRRRRRDSTVELNWVASASAVWTEFANSSRRLPTDSVHNLETDQTDYIAVWLYVNFDRYW